MNRLKKLLPDLIALLVFVLLSAAYFFPADIEGRILFQHDASAGAGAGQEAAEYYQATGERSRWTNSLFGGMPTYQISPSYPSTESLKEVQKIYHLYLPDYVYLAFIMMLGFYILLRAWGMSPWLSALGGMVWAFSSYFFILISAGHIWKFITLAYIPPTIAGMVMAYRGRLLGGGFVFALFAAFQILSNHVQMSYYFLFVMVAIALAFLFQAVRERQMKRFLKATGVLAVAGVIGLGINASNLYHTWSYSQETMRGQSEPAATTGQEAQKPGNGLDKDYITQWSYGIGETLTLLVPNARGGASEPLSLNERAMRAGNPLYSSLYGSLTQYFGDQPMTSGPVYVGAFVLFLFCLGCLTVKGPMKWAMLGITVFSIVLSWGKNFMPPTDFFIDHAPMYNKFRAVSSILVIAEFSIPLLAMLALQQVLRQPQLLTKERRAVMAAAGITLGVALLMAIAPSLFTDFIPQQELHILQNAASQGSIPQSELGGILQSLTDMRCALFQADAWRSVLFIAAGLGLLYLFAAGKLRREYTVAAIFLLCLTDLWAVNKRYLNDEQFVSSDVRVKTFVQTDTDRRILQDTATNYRVLNFATSTFNENTTSYWHKSVGGYHAAKLRRYQDMIEQHIAPEMSSAYAEVARVNAQMPLADPTQFKVLNMLNTRWFIFPSSEGGTFPIRNTHAMGNAWFVSQVDYVNHANEEIEALHTADVTTTAVVDARFKEALEGASALSLADDATIALTSYQPNRLTYHSENSDPGVAVFSEIYYPNGWQVSIDGKPAPLARANYVLRALHIPAGSHTIEMHFDPQSLHITEAIAYAALAALVIAALAALWFLVKRGKAHCG